MNTSVEDSGQMNEPEVAESCSDAACSCNARGLSTKAKMGVCLLVALAAVVVVSLSSASKARAVTSPDTFAAVSATASPTPTSPAAARPVAPPAADTPAAPTTTQAESTAHAAASAMPAPAAGKPAAPTATKAEPAKVWGPTLSSLASLNEVATDKDAVFVFLPAKDGKQTGTIKAQVGAAVKKSQAQGSATMAYTLSRDAKEYTEVAKQAPTPCVLVMTKGAGTATVTGEITEAKLLGALVTASRPSSCGPSTAGCGPSGCG